MDEAHGSQKHNVHVYDIRQKDDDDQKVCTWQPRQSRGFLLLKVQWFLLWCRSRSCLLPDEKGRATMASRTGNGDEMCVLSIESLCSNLIRSVKVVKRRESYRHGLDQAFVRIIKVLYYRPRLCIVHSGLAGI